MKYLSIDIETFSDLDLTKVGLYRYVESPKFEILMIAYAFENSSVEIIDVRNAEKIPDIFLSALTSKDILKSAYNAAFEYVALKKYLDLNLDIASWRCTMVHASYIGFIGSLDHVSKALGIETQKDSRGKALISYFAKPCKATKANNGRIRNLPEHDFEKWETFKDYCKQDVVVERNTRKVLEKNYIIPEKEHKLYALDQKINDRGILVCRSLAENAIKFDETSKWQALLKLSLLTGKENPNSNTQLKEWFFEQTGEKADSLDKESVKGLLEKEYPEKIKTVLELKNLISKTSIAKYKAMLSCMNEDDILRGVFRFYGASTGRWASRLVQLQNLPRNNIETLDMARNLLLMGDFEMLNILYDSAPVVLSELIRTSFIAKKGYKFVIVDFSAIEARVIAWLAKETWRLEVFKTHGKIYEASASQMFGIPLENITKNLRSKGKIAELALGYQGGVGALKAMGALKMGLKEEELKGLVEAWRKANANIKKLWYIIEHYCKKAVMGNGKQEFNGLLFKYENGNLYIKLHSGRELCYFSAIIEKGHFGNEIITYKGRDSAVMGISRKETYGGKLVENIIQAIARDCLAETLLRIEEKGYPIVMHVHDEVVVQVPKEQNCLEDILGVMAEPMGWAADLLLKGAGFESEYYIKD